MNTNIPARVPRLSAQEFKAAYEPQPDEAWQHVSTGGQAVVLQVVQPHDNDACRDHIVRCLKDREADQDSRKAALFKGCNIPFVCEEQYKARSDQQIPALYIPSGLSLMPKKPDPIALGLLKPSAVSVDYVPSYKLPPGCTDTPLKGAIAWPKHGESLWHRMQTTARTLAELMAVSEPNRNDLAIRAEQHKLEWALIQAAEELLYMHEAGIAHCDISPENVVLNAQGHAHWIDFDLAHNTHTLKTDNLTELRGKNGYSSPEAQKHQSSWNVFHNDVYAFGKVVAFTQKAINDCLNGERLVLFSSEFDNNVLPRCLKPESERITLTELLEHMRYDHMCNRKITEGNKPEIHSDTELKEFV